MRRVLLVLLAVSAAAATTGDAAPRLSGRIVFASERGSTLGAAAYAGVERVDRGDFLASELEVEDVEVLGDPGPTVWHAALTIRRVTFQHAGPGERR